MAAMPSLRTFILQHHNILGTSALALLLIVLEKFMESEFICPSDPGLGIGYSVVFLFMPMLVLMFLGCKLSDGICCNRSSSCSQVMYAAKQIFSGPLLWFLILLSDGRYIDCYGKSSGNYNPRVKPITQICGIVIISVLIALSFYLDGRCCHKIISACYFHNKYEEKILQELEEGLRSKASEKEKEVVDDIIEIVEDNLFKPEEAKWLEDLEDIIYKEKEKIKEKFRNDKIITVEERIQAAGRREERQRAARERAARQEAAVQKAAERAAGQRATREGAAEVAAGQGATREGAAEVAAGQGATREGAAGQGATREGAAEVAAGQGATREGAAGQGATREGVAGQGAADGAATQGASGYGATEFDRVEMHIMQKDNRN